MAHSPRVAPLFLVGATGTGKSAAAMELARRLAVARAAILCLDAMQVYRGADIGTSKPTAAERAEIPHGGLDLVEFGAAFDVAQYLAHAAEFLREQRAAGRRVIVVGGTGLYFRALTRGLCEAPQGSDELARGTGGAFAWRNCARGWRQVDPAMLEQLDATNPRRLARAIEVMESTGKSLRAWQEETPEPLVQRFHGVLACSARRRSWRRGSRRGWRRCLRQGWVEEVRGLIAQHGAEAVKAFPGHRIPGDRGGSWSCADKRVPDQLRAALQRDILVATRQYAKRQLTWFAREPNLVASDAYRHPVLFRAARCALPVALKATHLTSPPPGNERALLVGLETPDDSKWDHAESLQELGELVKSAGGEVVDTAIQRRPAPTAAYYIGPGKANELAELCKKENVGTVIFNDELSPGAKPQPGKSFRAQDSRPHAAHPRHLRAAREIEGRQAADRAGAVAISAAAADRHVDAPVAAERRHRHAGPG